MSATEQKIIAGNMNFIWGSIANKSKTMIQTNNGSLKIKSIRTKAGVDMELTLSDMLGNLTFVTVNPNNCGEIRSNLF